MTTRAALLPLLLLASTSCDFDRNTGQRCVDSSTCNDDGEDALEQNECVFVDDRIAVCLPVPDERAPLACTNDDECKRREDAPWPVEADCEDGFCRCSSLDFSCAGNLVLDPLTCRCVVAAESGEACTSADACEDGLACDLGFCAAGGSGGASCREDRECASFECDNDTCL